MLLDSPIKSVSELPALLDRALKFGVSCGLCSGGKEVVVLSSTSVAGAGARGRVGGALLLWSMHASESARDAPGRAVMHH
jgi:hypothetical protein